MLQCVTGFLTPQTPARFSSGDTNPCLVIRTLEVRCSPNAKPGQLGPGRLETERGLLGSFVSCFDVAAAFVEVGQTADRCQPNAHSLEQLRFVFLGESEQIRQ